MLVYSYIHLLSVSAKAGGMYDSRDDGVLAVDGGFSCTILCFRSRPNDVIGKIGDFGC